MAEAFGTGAGIVGVISLLVQISQVVVKFGMDWKDAPDNVKAFMAELGTLKTVLSETNTNIVLNPVFEAAFPNRPSIVLSELGPNAPSTTETKRMLEICRKDLSCLLADLKKKEQGHRLGWERLKGAFLAKDTRESVENLCRKCQILNKMLSIDGIVLGANTYREVVEARKEQQEWHESDSKTSLVIKSGVEQSSRWQESQDDQAILNWITPSDYTSQQSDFIGRRQEGTGQWLLDSFEFQNWLRTAEKTLFCPGIPGAGKTILTSIVVEQLTTRFKGDKSIGIAYLYCNFRSKDTQKINDLLSSLLRQLSEGQPSMPTNIKDLYELHKAQRTRPSVDEIGKALQSVATLYSRIFICVDALDECQVTDLCLARFTSELFSLQATCGANIFITSRFMPDIMSRFQKSIILEIRASEDDVRRYLDSHILHLTSFNQCNLDLQEEVKTEIIKAVDGMFLLAQLHLDSLIGKPSPKAIRTALRKLPSGSNAYSEAYKDAMIRIEGQVADQEQLAKQVLAWITCAKRPLTTAELQHALGVEDGEPEFDNENLPQIGHIISSCVGLVTIDEESDIIRLVHYTMQEYFERTQNRWFPDAETKITETCVTYLSFDTFGSGYCQTDSDFEERLRLNPLYEYAAKNWGRHAQIASTTCTGVEEFLQKRAQVRASTQALLAYEIWSGRNVYSQEFPKDFTRLHLAAYFGLYDIVKLLLDSDICDLIDSYGRTPLSWAAVFGREAVVKLLIESGAEIETKDKDWGRTPLSWAARQDREAVVKLLLDKGAEIEKKDNQGQTPLSWAARQGREAVVKLLLDKGAEIEKKDNWGQTPLFLAIRFNQEAIVKLLLDKGAKIEAKDNHS